MQKLDHARTGCRLPEQEIVNLPERLRCTGDPLSKAGVDVLSSATPTRNLAGLSRALAAYITWGCAPIYYKAVAVVPVPELLAHRAVWSAFLLVFLTCVCGRWREALTAVSIRRNLGVLAVTATLLGTTWAAFLWAVAHDQVLQASMAYFVSPLVSVALGYLFLGERLRTWQWISVLLATSAVVYLWVAGDQPPAVVIVMATARGLYALLRKMAPVDPLAGVAVETILFVPFAVAYLAYLGAHEASIFTGGSWWIIALLPMSGLVTGVPLVWYVQAARRLRLSTLGFLLYVTPSITFLLSITAFGETLSRPYLSSFVCIWTALLIYSLNTVRTSRRRLGKTPGANGMPAGRRVFLDSVPQPMRSAEAEPEKPDTQSNT
ncbi:MAG: EamA family transporter RarD [Phycisphaerales bacterium]|nr:MAG: EamA family transporter RarD [Phycisphaerales bacterium]